MQSLKKYYRIDRREISFVKFILEAYDGVAVMSTLDSLTGDVMFYVSPGCEEQFEGILLALKPDIMIEERDVSGLRSNE